MELTPKSGISSPIDLIPRGFLCWVKVDFRGMKVSPTTGSRYGDVALTVADSQPYQRKKIFTKVADPDHKENSEKYRQMGTSSLTRMVEAAGLVNTEDRDSYEKLNGKSCEAVLMLLHDKYVAIKVKVENGTGGYEDKNDVGEFLSPNKDGQSYKNYLKLSNGDHGAAAVAGGNPRQGGFGGAATLVGPPTQRQSGFAQQQLADAVAEPKPQPAEAAGSGGFNPNATPAYLKAGPQ